MIWYAWRLEVEDFCSVLFNVRFNEKVLSSGKCCRNKTQAKNGEIGRGELINGYKNEARLKRES